MHSGCDAIKYFTYFGVYVTLNSEWSIQTDYYGHDKALFGKIWVLRSDEEFEDLLKSLTIDVMPAEYESFDDMLIHQKSQSMWKRKAGKISYVSNG